MPRHLVRHARQQIGINLKRPLPLDQPARYIGCNRLHDVGYFIGFRQHAASHSAVMQKTIKTLVAAHRDMGKRVDPQPWCLAAADAAIEQIDFRRYFREQRIEGFVKKLEPRQFGIAQIDDDIGALGRFDTRLMDRLF